MLLVASAAACAGEGGSAEGDGGADAPLRGGEAAPEVARQLERELARVDSAARAADAVFKPLPLLTPGQEGALRAFGNAAQLQRARRLGIGRSPSDDQVAAALREGELVPLEAGEYWVVGELDHSRPLVVPGVRSLLEEIGRRFHARLRAAGVPAFRFEVSSVLRSAADQAALRRVNPNAATGESTHEYGTTVDVLYSAFAAPAQPIAAIGIDGVPWARSLVERYGQVAAERVAARRAMELKGILGEVLIEVQREGLVMVTLERQQPVFHMTLAREP